jgi:hypothetical protein
MQVTSDAASVVSLEASDLHTLWSWREVNEKEREIAQNKTK